MVLKMVPERLKGEQATIPIVENPLPTSSVELVAQDEAIAATSTAKSPTYGSVEAGREEGWESNQRN